MLSSESDSVTFNYVLTNEDISFVTNDKFGDLFSSLSSEVDNILDTSPGFWEDLDKIMADIEGYDAPLYESKPSKLVDIPKTIFDSMDRTENPKEFNRFDLDIE